VCGAPYRPHILTSAGNCEVLLCPFAGHSNEDEIVRGHFQQDGATAHTHTHTQRELVFPRRFCAMSSETIILKDMWHILQHQKLAV
jgi:hypothetical protein